MVVIKLAQTLVQFDSPKTSLASVRRMLVVEADEEAEAAHVTADDNFNLRESAR